MGKVFGAIALFFVACIAIAAGQEWAEAKFQPEEYAARTARGLARAEAEVRERKAQEKAARAARTAYIDQHPDEATFGETWNMAFYGQAQKPTEEELAEKRAGEQALEEAKLAAWQVEYAEYPQTDAEIPAWKRKVAKARAQLEAVQQKVNAPNWREKEQRRIDDACEAAVRNGMPRRECVSLAEPVAVRRAPHQRPTADPVEGRIKVDSPEDAARIAKEAAADADRAGGGDGNVPDPPYYNVPRPVPLNGAGG